MNECEEIDLSCNINVFTTDKSVESEISKWLFNMKFSLIGNVLEEIDDMPYNLELININIKDLCFKCYNSSGVPMVVCLLDAKEENRRYMLVLKSSDEDYVYRLELIDGKIFIFGDKDNKIKKRAKQFVG